MTGSLAAYNYCLMPHSLSTGLTATMLAEATALAEQARRVKGNYYCVNRDQSISSPRLLSTAAAGPVLQAIYRDAQRLALLGKIIGRPLSPTRACYIYYRPGDYIGLHKDASVCEVTLITSVAGPLEALVVHPSLIGISVGRIVDYLTGILGNATKRQSHHDSKSR